MATICLGSGNKNSREKAFLVQQSSNTILEYATTLLCDCVRPSSQNVMCVVLGCVDTWLRVDRKSVRVYK